MVSVSRFLAIAGILVLPGAAGATVPGHTPELDNLYRQAQSMLDDTDDNAALGARRILEVILERDPEYAAAYVELARFVLRSNYRFTIGGRNVYTDVGLFQAQQLLDLALDLEPEFADTLVVYGLVASAMEREAVGLILLERAEQLGSTSERLWSHRARIQSVRGHLAEARKSYIEARQYTVKGSAADLAVLEALTQLAETFEEAEGYYRELLWLLPDSAYARGGYATFLLRQGHFDEAIELAKTAGRIDEYPFLTATLAGALYGKAANLMREQDPVNAGALFLQADSLDYSPEEAMHSAASWPATRHVVFALHERGVNINATNGRGDTVLWEFARDATIEQVRELLARGADPDIWGHEAPLLTAILRGSPEIVQALLDAGADSNAVLLDDERAMDIALRMGLPDIERLLEAAGGEATPPPWIAILNGVGDGDVSSMQQAIHYLQTREPNNELIAALQHRLVEDPSVVLPLTRDYGHVRKILCGYPAADDDTLSIERRAAALQGAYPNAVERGISYDFNMCQRALEGARTEPRPMIPERPTPEQRPALLALAAELFQQSSGPDEQRSEADKIVTRLVAFGPDDVDARLLAARIEIAKGESMAGRSNNAQDLMDRLKIAARHLESALRIDPDFDEALALYVQLLSREGHAGISEVVSLAAGPNLTEPALQ